MTTYRTFLPNYYGSLVRGQQQALLLDNLYFFVADGVSKDATANTNPKCIADEQKVISEIICGGKLTPPELVAVVRRVDWQANKVFARYDSYDPELGGKDFYCINKYGHVYKCLYNNNNSPSIIEPTTSTPGPFKLSDGYVWTYMYKLTDNQIHEFSVGEYIPVIVDPAVTAAAVKGTISTIDVIDPGYYPHTHTGQVVSVVSNTVVRIEDTANSLSSIYDSMGFYIDSGAVAQISNYVANTSGKFVFLDRPIAASIGNGYEIAPYVNISGNGFGGSARAVMRDQYVDRIEILNRGSEFTMANAELVANPTFGNITGELRVNLSPIKGHGGDLYQELYVADVLYHINMDNYTFEHLPVNEISFSKVGLIRQITDGANDAPYAGDTFDNTFKIETTPVFGEFNVGDTIRSQYSPTGASGKLIFANNTVIIGTYDSPHLRFSEDEVIVNQDGVISTIQSIIQPDVRLIESDIVALINTNTIQREENSREMLQILIKFK